MPKYRSLVICLFTALSCIMVQATELRSTLQDQHGVAVTIYNENLALVKDQRRIQLGSGQSTLAFRDVSARMRPETALLRSLNNPGKLAVIEQNFDFDLLTHKSQNQSPVVARQFKAVRPDSQVE